MEVGHGLVERRKVALSSRSPRLRGNLRGVEDALPHGAEVLPIHQSGGPARVES